MIVITGATGHTGKPAAEALLAKGEKVRVIGRDAHQTQAASSDAGAEAFVGNVEDPASMTKAFDGATAVYLVLPEDVSHEDLRAHQERSFRQLRRRHRKCARALRRKPQQHRRATRRKRPAPSSACTIWNKN